MIPPSLYEPFLQLLTTLNVHVERLSQRYQAHMACKKGCSFCCADRFEISAVEALYLKAGFDQLPTETQVLIQKNLELGAGQAGSNEALPGQHCPMLVDGACSVYQHRPITCRAYGLLVSWQGQISTCSLNFNNLQDTQLEVLAIDEYHEILNTLSHQLPVVQSQQLPLRAPIRDYMDSLL